MRLLLFVASAVFAASLARGAVAEFPSPSSSPVNTVTAPVCQWGDCSPICPEPCPGGTICGIDGTCVQTASREQMEQVEEDRHNEVLERQDAIRSEARRQRARYLLRVSIGGGLGGVSLVGTQGRAGLFVGQLGMRQQLDPTKGVHLQLVANYGLRQEHRDSGAQATLTLQEAAAEADLYFGPFRRFYLGPAALAGYRWYSQDFVQWFAPEVKVQNRVVREGGLRMGLLAGSEEQFDISALVTSSFDDDTPLRGIVTLAYEFR